MHRRAALLAALAALAGARSLRADGRVLEVKVGEELEFTLPRLAQIIDTEDHAIATLTVLPDGRARVRGVAPGRTRIVGRDFGDLPMIFPVLVTPR